MHRKIPWPVLIAVGLSLSGCEALGLVCTDVGDYAITVEVRDAETGENASDGATLIVRDGEYVDSVQTLLNDPGKGLSAAPERAGTYDVRVRKAGYRDWTRQGVRVGRGGGCDRLQSAKLRANLERVVPSQ